MNFDEIQQTWRSPLNQPSAAQLEKQKMVFVSDLKRRHRGNLLLLALVFALLAFFTGKLLLQVFWPDPQLDKIDLSREWAVLPFFALPWIAWIALVVLYRRHRRQHPDYAKSIHASVAGLLDENRMERVRYKIVGVLLAASVLVLPLVAHQLRAVGKSGDEILIPAYVIYPGYVLLTLVWSAFHYRRKLLARKRELEALLATYDDKAASGT
jgi:hypothetical protein